MLKTKLKVGSVNSLTDGRYFAAMGAEWIGFCFDNQADRFIDQVEAKEIMNWLSGPRFVGEFQTDDVKSINQITKDLGIGIVQSNQPLDLSQLGNHIENLIQLIGVTKENVDELFDLMNEQKNWTSQFVLDFTNYDSEIDTNRLAQLCEEFPVFLKMNFAPKTILDFLAKTQPFGIEIVGGEELSTGLQSFDEIDVLLEELEED